MYLTNALKFLNLEGLREYDKLIKEEITSEINTATQNLSAISINEETETLIITQ